MKAIRVSYLDQSKAFVECHDQPGSIGLIRADLLLRSISYLFPTDNASETADCAAVLDHHVLMGTPFALGSHPLVHCEISVNELALVND